MFTVYIPLQKYGKRKQRLFGKSEPNRNRVYEDRDVQVVEPSWCCRIQCGTYQRTDNVFGGSKQSWIKSSKDKKSSGSLPVR
jgi:hypothetical protein